MNLKWIWRATEQLGYDACTLKSGVKLICGNLMCLICVHLKKMELYLMLFEMYDLFFLLFFPASFISNRPLLLTWELTKVHNGYQTVLNSVRLLCTNQHCLHVYILLHHYLIGFRWRKTNLSNCNILKNVSWLRHKWKRTGFVESPLPYW